MSSISGIDSSSLLYSLFNSLNNPASSNTSPNTETSGTDTQEASAASAATSTNSLLDQMKISSLQNQCSFVASLFSSDDPTSSTSADSLTSVLENAETEKMSSAFGSNTQLAQLFNALNLSSSSSATNNPLESLLQSLDGSGLSQNNSDAILTALEDLSNSSGNTVNSSAQGLLDQYHSLSAEKSSQIKTIV